MLFFHFFLDGLREETEIHLAVMALFHKVGMLVKMLVFVMFEYEHPAFAQQVAFEDEINQFIVLLPVVVLNKKPPTGMVNSRGQKKTVKSYKTRFFFKLQGLC